MTARTQIQSIATSSTRRHSASAIRHAMRSGLELGKHLLTACAFHSMMQRLYRLYLNWVEVNSLLQCMCSFCPVTDEAARTKGQTR